MRIIFAVEIKQEQFIGYELCKSNSCTGCWRTSHQLENVANLNVDSSSLSENSLILALIDSISYTVRIYDNDGSKWIMRDNDIKGKSLSFSSGGTRLAMVKISSLAGGSVVVSDRFEHCQRGTTRAFFTFITDSAPDELSWKFFS